MLVLDPSKEGGKQENQTCFHRQAEGHHDSCPLWLVLYDYPDGEHDEEGHNAVIKILELQLPDSFVCQQHKDGHLSPRCVSVEVPENHFSHYNHFDHVECLVGKSQEEEAVGCVAVDQVKGEVEPDVAGGILTVSTLSIELVIVGLPSPRMTCLLDVGSRVNSLLGTILKHVDVREVDGRQDDQRHPELFRNGHSQQVEQQTCVQ